MAMHNPPHPGGIVRRQCLEPLGLSVTEAAKALGVTRQALSDLANERAGVSVERRTGFPRPSAPVRRLGWECKWPMTSGRRAAAPMKSECGDLRPLDRSILRIMLCEFRRRPLAVKTFLRHLIDAAGLFCKKHPRSPLDRFAFRS